MRINASIDVDAPAADVWELVGSPCTYPTFMAGVARFSPSTDTTTGVGARFVVRLQVGSVPVGALIEIVEQADGRDLAWTSVTGLDHRGRWRLRERDDGTTHVSLRLSYTSPGRLFGMLADHASAPMLQRALDDTLRALKSRVEGRPVPAPARRSPLDLVRTGVAAGRVARSVGLLRPANPVRLLDAAAALRRYGVNPAAVVGASAARFPDEPAVIDDGGAITFAELDRRTAALAAGFADHGIGPGTTVGLLARNHRGFVEAVVGLSKVGADIVLLNTGFSAPQVAGVCADEGITVLLHDDDLADAAAGAEVERLSESELSSLAARDVEAPPAPPRMGRIVILTSGTTGKPKGAPRTASSDISPAVALLSRLPLQLRDTTVVAPPLFHAWGFAHLVLGLSLSSTLVLSRQFDATRVLQSIERHQARVLVVVPVMLERFLKVPVGERPDTSSLEVVAASGSAVPAALGERFMDAYGDVLYNLYGSTEVAWATIADPAQLRAAPGTAGTPPPGTTVEVVGPDGIALPRGEQGRIFVGNGMGFSGYTNGGGKEVLRGLIDTGDVGRFDVAGRLFVEGRSDDMIVSGGENVFPQEVEEVLTELPGVQDVAVVGVDDEQFGQRLAAFVVAAASAELSEEAVKDHVRGRLARYKVPRQVEFVEELPRNPTGKVLRRELVERAGAR